MSEAEVVEAEVVEPGAEIVPVPPTGPMSLFRTDDPAEVLKRAKETADALAPVIRKAGQVVSVQGKDYLTVEAWQTLGQQVGVTPVVTETRRVSDPDGWEARCEARTLDGRTIGAADSMCTRDEVRWKDSEDFEVRSMAQTRAMSRALASVLRFIPTLAGMGGTPAEEMGNAERKGGKGFASEKQRSYFERLLQEKAKFDKAGAEEVCDYLRSRPKPEVRQAIDGIKDPETCEDFAGRLHKAAAKYAEKLADEVSGTAVEEPQPTGDTPLG